MSLCHVSNHPPRHKIKFFFFNLSLLSLNKRMSNQPRSGLFNSVLAYREMKVELANFKVSASTNVCPMTRKIIRGSTENHSDMYLDF
jgi:hypothetical protein